jgi:hypothetical protein
MRIQNWDGVTNFQLSGWKIMGFKFLENQDPLLKQFLSYLSRTNLYWLRSGNLQSNLHFLVSISRVLGSSNNSWLA